SARSDSASASSGAASRAAGISLGDANVLLITVDALRADRLAAYGGDGLTPAMDALAREGVAFTRAYTPTPHTSYAVSSLLTGKYLRPVLELAREPTDHPTLPDLVRRYGFRTAAFYPPAIFYVDAERFRPLADRGYGFEYRKEMFAPAGDRVAQVEEYLDGLDDERPVFVWVHLFEPHEPYDPPPEFARGDSAEARYNGEVAYADQAIGELVRSFRARRPGATVILTADHGEELGDHGGQFHGSTVYDEQVRVPLVWSSPGVVAPGSSDAPVELIDVATTLLAALGIPRDARMRGDDLGPLLAGADSIVTEHAFAAVDNERMITDGRLKVICEIRAPSCRLYDLVGDPAERTNLAEQQPMDEARLREAL
ncbi:MAG: sulfatase, partial [Polyangiaceae bacterium]|nr:sulfatase [Polyangiaceae bacterium]